MARRAKAALAVASIVMASAPKSRSAEPGSEACVEGDEALARAFEFLGKRWNAMILAALAPGPAGFAEISRGIEPISDSVLSGRLSELSAPASQSARAWRVRTVQRAGT